MWLAEYIAKIIEVKHRFYKKDELESYKYFYNSSEDSFIYNKNEEREIYNLVDSILTNKYNLLVANNAFDDKHNKNKSDNQFRINKVLYEKV